MTENYRSSASSNQKDRFTVTIEDMIRGALNRPLPPSTSLSTPSPVNVPDEKAQHRPGIRPESSISHTTPSMYPTPAPSAPTSFELENNRGYNISRQSGSVSEGVRLDSRPFDNVIAPPGTAKTKGSSALPQHNAFLRMSDTTSIGHRSQTQTGGYTPTQRKQPDQKSMTILNLMAHAGLVSQPQSSTASTLRAAPSGISGIPEKDGIQLSKSDYGGLVSPAYVEAQQQHINQSPPPSLKPGLSNMHRLGNCPCAPPIIHIPKASERVKYLEVVFKEQSLGGALDKISTCSYRIYMACPNDISDIFNLQKINTSMLHPAQFPFTNSQLFPPWLCVLNVETSG